MERREMGGRLISATEIASWAYCPEQWRLQHGLGHESQNQVSMRRGDRHHARNAGVERIAGGSIRLGWGLILAAAALLTLWGWLHA